MKGWGKGEARRGQNGGVGEEGKLKGKGGIRITERGRGGGRRIGRSLD